MRKHLFFIIYTILLISASVFSILSTFVITKEKTDVPVLGTEPTIPTEIEEEKGKFFKDESGNKCYKDSNIEIKIIQKREYETEIYIADIKIKDFHLMKTALANDTFGLNVKEKPSKMAERVNAILAINGDYYSFREKGYVIRNGLLYDPNRVPRDSKSDILIINNDGSFTIQKEIKETSTAIYERGAWQVFCFGPGLISNNEILVNEKSEVAAYKASNPRTAIGYISEGHYVMVVSDGRTTASAGLSLYELALVLKDYGVKDAYNLDGGGSSVMIFNGKIINQPTSNGEDIRERSSSDIVYIGY
jgi:exopolysaccharide biosynthesis protein